MVPASVPGPAGFDVTTPRDAAPVRPSPGRARCASSPSRRAEETEMAKKTAMGMSKRTLVQALNGSAALFGVTGLFTPRALGGAYGVPSSPHTRQLLRL